MDEGNAIHEDGLDWTVNNRPGYRWRRRQLGVASGAARLGCSLYELEAGQRTWPYHFHCANEEAIYVLSGRGRVRTESGSLAVTAGSYVTFRAGTGGAHQIVADADSPLRFLMMSTMDEPDITVYPESGKVGLFAGSAPGGSKEDRVLGCSLPLSAAVDYWAGEEVDEAPAGGEPAGDDDTDEDDEE